MTAALALSAALLCGTLAAWLFSRNRELDAKLKKAEGSIAQTSRLLIEKNIELFDQNVHQQKELAIKDDFIAIASHQLRTPLNEIKWGLGEMLSTLQAEARQRGEKVLGSAARMERIVEDLLQFVAVEQGHKRSTVEAFEPDGAVRSAAERVAADFAGRRVSLETHLSFGRSITSIDKAALDMIVSNLVENAFHYTPDGGQIRVATRVGKDGAFELTVEDSGIGIKQSAAQNIFVKFRRASEAIELNKEGSGLGLYIVKTLVDRTGGTIVFASEPGKGTLFTLSLPRGRSS